MRTKKFKNNKVNIITLGCSKNLVDSEALSAQLLANEFEVEHESEKDDSNIVIVNTCGFIDKAKEESINTILEQIERKKNNEIEKVYVTGCLSHRYKEDMIKEMPEVDAFFGTMELPNILKTLEADFKEDLVGERLLATPSHYAYLKISEGCNRTCTFCAIPLMRGNHISKSIDDLVIETKLLAQKGVKEIMLIAQELTYYGLDIYKKRMLPELVQQLSEIEGIEWIRLHYAYPSKFPLEILDLIKNNPKVCKYIDMPLQHISDNMLLKMKRQITKKEIIDLISEIRTKIQDIAFRTSFIVGFPGETQQDFDELIAFIEEMKFDRVGVFTYSHEENTAAYAFEDTLSDEEKEERAQHLIQIQQDISYENNLKFIGKTLKVLIDKVESGRYIGRTEYDSVEVDNEVIINTDKDLTIGEFYNIQISNAYDYDLEGDLV